MTLLRYYISTQNAPRHTKRGVAATEFALVFPLIVLTFLAFVELIIFIQSSIVTELAAFQAARSFQVYGDRRLSEINYPHLRAAPFTNGQQTIAEATAERVIIESLMWEHVPKLEVEGDALSTQRYYKDGNDLSYDTPNAASSSGSVQVNLLGCRGGNCDGASGLEVTYCAPIVFPGAAILFAQAKENYPCKGLARQGKQYAGIAITRRALLGREPLTP